MIRMLALLLLFGWSTLLGAQVIKVPIGAQGSAVIAEHLPERGTSMEAVRSAWGEPAARQAAVGQPPITRWDYPEFFVYFEYSHVLHAVLRHKPVAPPAP